MSNCARNNNRPSQPPQSAARICTNVAHLSIRTDAAEFPIAHRSAHIRANRLVAPLPCPARLTRASSHLARSVRRRARMRARLTLAAQHCIRVLRAVNAHPSSNAHATTLRRAFFAAQTMPRAVVWALRREESGGRKERQNRVRGVSVKVGRSCRRK